MSEQVRDDSVIPCDIDFPAAKEGGQVVANFTGVISSVKRGGNHGDPHVSQSWVDFMTFQ